MSMVETLIATAGQLEEVQSSGAGIEEVVGDKRYHANEAPTNLRPLGVRSYSSEPDRCRRCWRARRCPRRGVCHSASDRRARGVACCGDDRNWLSDRLRRCTRTAGRGGSIFEGIPRS